MRILKQCLFTVFLLVYLLNFSLAREYKRAYVLNNQGDSIYGQILESRKVELSFEIVFKPNSNSDSTIVLTPDSIREFCFLDKQIIYNTVAYWYYKENEKIVTKRFGRQIYCDKCTLYKIDISGEEANYKFEKETLYSFVLKLDTAFYTLSQREVVAIKDSDVPFYAGEGLADLSGKQVSLTKTYSTLKKDYIGILKYLLRDCPKSFSDVNHLYFTDKEMVSFVKKYGNCLVH